MALPLIDDGRKGCGQRPTLHHHDRTTGARVGQGCCSGGGGESTTPRDDVDTLLIALLLSDDNPATAFGSQPPDRTQALTK